MSSKSQRIKIKKVLAKRGPFLAKSICKMHNGKIR